MFPMVHTVSTSNRRIDLFSLAEAVRSVVTVGNRSASTVFSVKGTTSALTIHYRNAAGPIRSRERVLVAQGRVNLPQGADAAVPRQLIKLLVGLIASHGQALPPSPRTSILWKIRFLLSIHNHMAFPMKWIPGSNSWKVARCSARPPHRMRLSRLSLQLRNTL